MPRREACEMAERCLWRSPAIAPRSVCPAVERSCSSWRSCPRHRGRPSSRDPNGTHQQQAPRQSRMLRRAATTQRAGAPPSCAVVAHDTGHELLRRHCGHRGAQQASLSLEVPRLRTRYERRRGTRRSYHSRASACSASLCMVAHSASTCGRSLDSAPIDTRTIQRPSRTAGVK